MPAANPIHGGLYWVRDDKLSLPPNDVRALHDRRMVVILSGPTANQDPNWPMVLVAPLSSQSTRATRFCVKLAAGESNVIKKVWIRTGAVQPMLKTDLEDRVGILTEERLLELQARLFQYMEIATDPDAG